MKTIKVIDLLNIIAKCEDVPEKIIYRGYSYRYCKSVNDYENIATNDGFLFDRIDSGLKLNDTIEIIEDTPKDKKIEKLEHLITDKYMENKWYGGLSKNEIVLDIQTLKTYINEIIDGLNSVQCRKDSQSLNDLLDSYQNAQISLQNQLVKQQQIIDQAVEYLNHSKIMSSVEEAKIITKIEKNLLSILRGEEYGD